MKKYVQEKQFSVNFILVHFCSLNLITLLSLLGYVQTRHFTSNVHYITDFSEHFLLIYNTVKKRCAAILSELICLP